MRITERELFIYGADLECLARARPATQAGRCPAPRASCYAAAAQGLALSGDRAGQPSLRLVLSADPPPVSEPDNRDPVAEVRGVNVHARQWVHGNDRRAVERLGRYITRPPIAQDRLEERSDGTLLLTLKNP